MIDGFKSDDHVVCVSIAHSLPCLVIYGMCSDLFQKQIRINYSQVKFRLNYVKLMPSFPLQRCWKHSPPGCSGPAWKPCPSWQSMVYEFPFDSDNFADLSKMKFNPPFSRLMPSPLLQQCWWALILDYNHLDWKHYQNLQNMVYNIPLIATSLLTKLRWTSTSHPPNGCHCLLCGDAGEPWWYSKVSWLGCTVRTGGIWYISAYLIVTSLLTCCRWNASGNP